MGSQTQPLRTAVGVATCTRSTHGCGSLGAAGLAWGVRLCRRPRTGARRLSRLGRRRVKRPAAAARQRGAAMSETHGPSSAGEISQDIPVYASLRFLSLLIPRYVSSEILSLHIQGYASLPNLSQVILGYPISENLYWDILGYPDLPSLSFFQMQVVTVLVDRTTELP